MSTRGVVEIEIGGEAYEISFTNSALADADDYVRKEYGTSFVSAITSGGLDFSLLRIAFYFGARSHKSVRSVKQAGQILDEANIVTVAEAISEAIDAAFRQSGMVDDSGEA